MKKHKVAKAQKRKRRNKQGYGNVKYGTFYGMPQPEKRDGNEEFLEVIGKEYLKRQNK